MRLTTQVGLLAGASALALSGASFADATANDQETRIAELEAKVAELTGQSWMTEQRAMEVRGLVQDVLEDADTRSSLLQGGGMGYDNGFVIGNPDGGFGLKINGQLQVRHVFNNADESVVNGNGAAMPNLNPNLSGFENTRTKLMVSGNAGDWIFAIEGNYGVTTDATTADGTFNLEDAWVGYDFGNGWSVFMGQGRVPLQREHMVTSANQLAVERSTASYINPHGRTQGVMLAYEMDQWGFVAGFNDGAAAPAAPAVNTIGYTGVAPGLANSTVLVNPQGGGSMDTEYAFSFRGEYLAAGTWEQFEDFTSKQGSATGFLIGLGFHTQTGEYGTTAVSADVTSFSADLSYEGDGWNVFGAYTWTDIDYNTAVNKQQLNSIVVQGGFYLNSTWELFARYEWVDYDLQNVAAPALNPDDLSIITFGVNGYYTDNVKLSSDFSFGLNEIATTNSLTGVRTDGRGGTVGTPGSWNDGQFVWKTQLQLTF